jgi:hypothetical protein
VRPIAPTARMSERSARLEGQTNYFVSPTHIPIYYEQLHAKDGQ